MSQVANGAAYLLRRLDPETAHAITIAVLKAGLGPRSRRPADAVLRTRLAGIDLPNPLGLAAGFDKNAAVFNPVLAAGFGFVECGTVTPRRQEGNPRPRMFRLSQDRAVINRLGFNNAGVAAFASRLRGRRRGVVGVNVGPNRDTEDRIADYLAAVASLWGQCDYFTVNVSSPNTEGLRSLQHGQALTDLLAALSDARRSREGGPPFFLKIAPDLSSGEIESIVEAAQSSGIDGLIVSNTTTARPISLRSPGRVETGGLSGAPLFASSTRALQIAHAAARGRLALIGAGGVGSGEQAYAKIRAGASAIQLYTALTFEGPGLAQAILVDLADRLRADGFVRIADAVGAR